MTHPALFEELAVGGGLLKPGGSRSGRLVSNRPPQGRLAGKGTFGATARAATYSVRGRGGGGGVLGRVDDRLDRAPPMITPPPPDRLPPKPPPDRPPPPPPPLL